VKGEINVFATSRTTFKNIVVLPTAIVNVIDSNNQLQQCRILLDSGSQATFISEDCVKLLGLQRRSSKLLVQGISSTKPIATKGTVSVLLSSRQHPASKLWISGHILDKLTAPQPSKTFNVDMTLLSKYTLADPQFNKSRKIDILLGADYLFNILLDGKVFISPELPVLHQTIFGYIVAGEIRLPFETEPVVSMFADLTSIDENLKKFWEVEEVPTNDQRLSDDELYCEHKDML
jgi:hypothetical protein